MNLDDLKDEYIKNTKEIPEHLVYEILDADTLEKFVAVIGRWNHKVIPEMEILQTIIKDYQN